MHQNSLFRDVVVVDSLHSQYLGTKTLKCFYFPKLLTLFYWNLNEGWWTVLLQLLFTMWSLVSLKPTHLSPWNIKQEWGWKQSVFIYIYIYIFTETIAWWWPPEFLKNYIPLQFFKWRWFSFSKTSNTSQSWEGPVCQAASMCSKNKPDCDNWLWGNGKIHCSSVYQGLKPPVVRQANEERSLLRVLWTYFFTSNLLYKSVDSHLCLANQT